MKRFFKIFIFIMIIFLNINVFASDINATNYVSSGYVSQQSDANKKYYGTEIYNTGTRNLYSIGTRYSGRLSIIEYYLSWPFTDGYSATITMNMATEDWRNNFMGVQTFCAYSSSQISTHNMSTGGVNYISYKKIKFTVNPNENCSIVKIRLYSTNVGSTAFTGTSNWNLSSIYVNDSYYSGSSGGSGGGSSTPTPTPQPNNQDIINNATQNSQNIINNQNQNTQDIIDNNNSNTQSIIENQNELLGSKCSNLFDFPYSNLLPYRVVSDRQDYFVHTGDYLHLDSGVTYYFSYKSNQPYGNNNTGVEALLAKDNNYDYFIMLNGLSGAFQVNQSGDYYLRLDCNENGATCTYYDFMISKSSSNFCAFGSYSSKIDDTNSAINEVNNTLNNDNIDDNTGFFTDFDDNDHGLSSIITIPLSTIQNLTNTSCVALNVPIPFTNKNISLPCMTQVYQNAIPTVFNIWQIVSFGIISYLICLDIFKIVKGFKDPNEDKIEVLDL